MAKKQTYADVMKQLSKKKAQYEQGLEEANRTGNSSGIADYKRRLMKLSAGVDQLFDAQQVANGDSANLPKASKGMYTKYSEGGLTEQTFAEYKFLNSMLPQERTAADNARLQALQADIDAASQMGWQEDFGFNPDGSMAGRPIGGADIVTDAPPQEPYTGPSITPEGAIAKMNGEIEPAAPASFGGTPDLPFMNQIDGLVTAGAPDPATAAVAAAGTNGGVDMEQFNQATATAFGTTTATPTVPQTAASQPYGTPTTATTPTATTPQQREFQQVTPLGSLDASRVANTAKGDAYYPGGIQRDILGGPQDLSTDPSIPTRSHGLYDLGSRAANRFAGVGDKISGAMSGPLGMALGAAAQFLPDRAAMKAMNKLEGPVDMPAMRAAQLNTDLQVGNQLAQVQQANARANASIDRDISNPAVAAAARRAGQRVAAGQSANILAQEAAQETNMRNQNMQNLINNQNQNRQINAQNMQRTNDFNNERLTAQNRMRQQMSQKLGMAVGDFQNRAMDLKKWNMLSKLDQYGVAGRNDIDPIS